MKAVIDTDVPIYDTFEDSVFHEEARALLEKLGEWLPFGRGLWIHMVHEEFKREREGCACQN